MDLMAIGRTLAKHKILTGLVAVLTLGGFGYVMFAVPPTYKSSASLLLVQPPAPPTREEIEEDPNLADISTDNPYLRAGGVYSVVELLTRRGNEPEVKELFSGDGVSYDVAPSVAYSNVSPFIDVTSTAPTPTEAINTTQEVMDFLSSDLKAVQAAQGVDEAYMIATLPVDANITAESQISGKLRALVAVAGLGVVALFALMTFASAWDAYRMGRPSRSRGDKRLGRRAGSTGNSAAVHGRAFHPGEGLDTEPVARSSESDHALRPLSGVDGHISRV